MQLRKSMRERPKEDPDDNIRKHPNRLSLGLPRRKTLNGFLPARPSFVVPLPKFEFITKKKHSNNNKSSPPERDVVSPVPITTLDENDVLIYNPKEAILAEKERLHYIKRFIDAKEYKVALKELIDDSENDMLFFNRMKRSMLGELHDMHFQIPKYYEPPHPPRNCLWVGVNDRGIPMRCHNRCVAEKWNKWLNFCVYHVKYCINKSCHKDGPMNVLIQNEFGLCIECFILRNDHPPKMLGRIPGTRRKQ